MVPQAICHLVTFAGWFEMRPARFSLTKQASVAVPLLRTAFLRGGMAAIGLVLLASAVRADEWSDCVPGGGQKTEQACSGVIMQATRSS
jgi:hypothetical protein